MKTLPLYLTVLVLASCASQPPVKETPIREHISYMGAKSDLNPGPRMMSSPSDNPLQLGEKTITFPVTKAVVCTPAKDSCKHAEVRSELVLRTQRTKEGVLASGVLITETGRKFTAVEGDPSFGQSKVTLSVPDGIPLIDPETKQRRFEKLLRMGETLDIQGDWGVAVTLQFTEGAY